MMKKRFGVLAVLTCLLLVSCGKEPTPISEPVTLEELTLELRTADRSVEALLALQEQLPPLLQSALLEQNCQVNTVNLTFGSSDEASVQAISDGTVDVAVLAPMDGAFVGSPLLAATDSALCYSAEPAHYPANPTQDGTLGERSLLCLTGSDYAQTLQNGVEWLDLSGAVWVVPSESVEATAIWLGQHTGHSYTELPYFRICDSVETAKQSADTADILVLPAEVYDGELAVLAVTAPTYREILVATATLDPVVEKAVQNALLALWQSEEGHHLLQSYGYEQLGAVSEEALSALDEARQLFGDSEQ